MGRQHGGVFKGTNRQRGRRKVKTKQRGGVSVEKWVNISKNKYRKHKPMIIKNYRYVKRNVKKLYRKGKRMLTGQKGGFFGLFPSPAEIIDKVGARNGRKTKRIHSPAF